MRNLTIEEKMEFAKEMNKFCKENHNFCEDVIQLALLMKGSINFDDGINILAPNYGDTLSTDDKAFIMANIEAAMIKGNLFKENRFLHDCNSNKGHREVFVGACPNADKGAITVFAIDDSFKDEYIAQVVNLEDNKKIIILAIGEKYEDFLDKLGIDNTEIIKAFIHVMKEFVNLVYHDINQQYAIPSALSSLFLTVASFHPTEFENNLFADEEYGWFYDSILNTREYERSSFNNLRSMIEDDDPLSNLSLDKVDIEELAGFTRNVISCITKFLDKKPKATGEDKRAIKRFDYMNPKKEKYVKDIEIDEWLNTPLYSYICEYNGDKYIMAVSECFSMPKISNDFPAGRLITIPGNINGSEKEIIKIAYDILKFIVNDLSDDEEFEIDRMGGIFSIANLLNFKMVPDTFELIPDGFIKDNLEGYLKFRESAFKALNINA